ncbi:hypothetical protein [Spirosoma pomorum]
MNKQEATDFFADFYQGEHHIPSEVKKYGDGWCIHTQRGENLSTTDYSNLTRLIVLGHDRAVRVCLKGHNFGRILIIIHQRERIDDYAKGHPTIEDNIIRVREFTQDILRRIGRVLKHQEQEEANEVA